ncbi:hypothetical protein ACFCYX_29555 [Streptomyces populi]
MRFGAGPDGEERTGADEAEDEAEDRDAVAARRPAVETECGRPVLR